MKNKSNAACSITLDIAAEVLRDMAELVDYLEANDITFRVLTWKGPVSEPEVQFFGTHAALEKFVREQYTSEDEAQDDYIVSLIEPA